MISVPNLRLPLSGNKLKKLFAYLFVFPVLLACSTSKGIPADSIGYVAETKSLEQQSVQAKLLKEENAAPKKKQEIIVSYLLPFQTANYPANEIPDSKVYDQSALAIDYLNGAKIAIDSIHKSCKEKITVHIFDSQNDSNQVRKITWKPELAMSSVIFGPVYPDELSIMAGYSRRSKIPVVSPISPAALDTYKNPYFISANNTLESHAFQMADFMNRNTSKRKVLIVHGGTNWEERYMNAFTKRLDSLDKNFLIEVINTAQEENDLIGKSLNALEENYILIPSADQAYVIALLKYFNLLEKEYPITLLGHPVWSEFSSIDLGLMQKFKVHITTSLYVDYNNERVIQFVKRYRELYGVDPSDNAFRGFDQSYYFLSKLLKDPKLNLSKMKPEQGIASRFNFRSFGDSGYKNQELFVVKFQDYQLAVQP